MIVIRGIDFWGWGLVKIGWNRFVSNLHWDLGEAKVNRRKKKQRNVWGSKGGSSREYSGRKYIWLSGLIVFRM